VDEFDDIYEELEEKYDDYERERLDRKDRKRAVGGGRKFKLPLKERFLMLLVYYRLYITYSLVGFLFDMHLSNVCRDIKHLEPLVKQCIPIPERIEAKIEKMGKLEELLEVFPEMSAFTDAISLEIPRPKDKQKRKDYYSGKKKKHTIKTQITNNKKGLIVHISKSVEGKKHDYKLFKEQPPPIPKNIERIHDSGYQGIKKDFPELKVRIPYKKPKGRELTETQKEYNKELRRERVVSEHTIGKMKKYEIMGSKFRNSPERYDTMTTIIGGFVNYKTMDSDDITLK
jgi:hypothetical protein